LAIRNNPHSVAVDGLSGQAYLPFAPGVDALPNGGIQVMSMHRREEFGVGGLVAKQSTTARSTASNGIMAAATRRTGDGIAIAGRQADSQTSRTIRASSQRC
jgi:hypothetical protein